MSNFSKYQEFKSDKLIELLDEEYNLIKEFVYNTIGINLGTDKKTLVSGRLQKLLRKYNLSSFKDYYQMLRNEKTGEALSELADNISTNHTYFYREHSHFEYFKDKILPELIAQKRSNNDNDIRIWCAGCSSGEEPYMLVMLMMEVLGNQYGDFKAGILATDISTRALNTAIEGVYSADRIKNVPEKLTPKYFKKLSTGDYQVIDKVKNEVTYRRFNLMNQVFPFKKSFDIIFCRNVMIYFDLETRTNLVKKYYDKMNNGGYLFIGHSETIDKKSTKFTYIQPALYQKI